MRDQAVAAVHFRDDEIGVPAAVEAGAAVLGDPFERRGEVSLAERIADLIGLVAGLGERAQACGVPGEPLALPLELRGYVGRQRKAILGESHRGGEHVLPGQRPVRGEHVQEPGDRAGHADGEV